MHGCMLVTCLHPNASLNQYTQTNRYQPDTRYMPFLSPPLKLYRQPAAPLYIHTYATSPYTILSQPISYSYSITTPLHRCIGHITIYFLPQAFESSLPRSYFQSWDEMRWDAIWLAQKDAHGYNMHQRSYSVHRSSPSHYARILLSFPMSKPRKGKREKWGGGGIESVKRISFHPEYIKHQPCDSSSSQIPISTNLLDSLHFPRIFSFSSHTSTATIPNPAACREATSIEAVLLRNLFFAPVIRERER